VHYVPGEHDLFDEGERYGRGTMGAGWYSFDVHGVHFIGLVNVADLKPGGLGNLDRRQPSDLGLLARSGIYGSRHPP
jgi:hypothetical protein